MKNIIQKHNYLARLTLATALASLVLVTSTALALEKGAERLMKLNRPATAPTSLTADSKTVPMSCPKCQNMVKQVPDWNAKGGQILMAGERPTKSVVKHLCEGCSTTISVKGHGKTKQQVAQHTCTDCGAVSKSCCSTVQNGKPTPGM